MFKEGDKLIIGVTKPKVKRKMGRAGLKAKPTRPGRPGQMREPFMTRGMIERRKEMEKRNSRALPPAAGMLTGGQAKLDKNKNNKIDAQDFKILRAEKAKGRGKGLQDEKMKPGKIIKAKKSKFIERRKNLAGLGSVLRKDPTKAINRVGVKDRYGMDIKPKTSQLGKDLASQAAKAAKATRIGKIAAGVAGVALAAKAGLEKMYEKRTGKKPFTKRPDKKMGGGMMMRRPMMANKGKMTNKDKQERKTVKNLAKRGGTRGMVSDVIKGMGAYMSGGLTEATQKLKAQGKMGGGMMQRPMMAMGGGMMPGYKKGKSVMAKGCKLGRKKPTKMYTQEGECPSKESYRAQVD